MDLAPVLCDAAFLPRASLRGVSWCPRAAPGPRQGGSGVLWGWHLGGCVDAPSRPLPEVLVPAQPLTVVRTGRSVHLLMSRAECGGSVPRPRLAVFTATL